MCPFDTVSNSSPGLSHIPPAPFEHVGQLKMCWLELAQTDNITHIDNFDIGNLKQRQPL
jgi:hypothetical protein